MDRETSDAVTESGLSLMARLFYVVSAPGELFASLARRPFSIGNWIVPALLASLVGVACQLAIFGQPQLVAQIRELQDRAIRQQVDAGKINADQARAAREALGSELATTFIRVAGGVGALIYAVVSPFWWALLVWALGRFGLRSSATYRKALEVASLAALVITCGGVVSTFLAIGMGRLGVGPHLGMLLQQVDLLDRGHLALCVVNLFGLWHMALLGWGISVLANRPVVVGVGAMTGLWIGYKGLAVLLGMGAYVL